MEIRTAVPEDIEDIVALCRQKGCKGLEMRQVSGEARLEARLEAYRKNGFRLGNDPDLVTYVAVQDGRMAGYVMVVAGLRESITQETQAIIYDFAPATGDVLSRLVGQGEDYARERGTEYMILQIHPQAEEEDLFRSLGYFVDMNRIAHRVSTAEPPGLPEARERYQVRPARQSDHLFVLYLNTICAPYTMPAGRNLAPESIGERYMNTYFNLNLEDDPQSQTFVLEEKKGSKPCGFLIMKFGYCDEITREPLAYIYDIEVHPDHWGHMASQILMYESEQFCRDRGVQFILADVSETNPRALTTSTKHLGYIIEWRRWTRRL